jgi:hypothetical protein
MYTENDLTLIKQAILELAGGRRVVSLSINGREIRYGQAELPQLQALAIEVQNDINQPNQPRYSLIQSSKGL